MLDNRVMGNNKMTYPRVRVLIERETSQQKQLELYTGIIHQTKFYQEIADIGLLPKINAKRGEKCISSPQNVKKSYICKL